MKTNQTGPVQAAQHASEPTVTLFWPGKRLHTAPSAAGVGLLEASRQPPARGNADAGPGPGLLLHGDNFDGLSWLLANGYRRKVGLVYIDPPYNSNRAYTSKIRLRGKGQPVLAQPTEYEDVWQPGAYLQFLADRLLLLRELLHPDGTLWLHCDHRMQAHLLLLLQEIFGADCYLNTISWRSQTMRGAKVHARYFPNSAQSIHIFRSHSRGRPVWHPPRREIVLTEAEAAAKYMRDEQGFFRTSDPGTYSFERLTELHAQGRLYAPYGGQVVVDADARRVYPSNGGNLGVKYYLQRTGRSRFAVTRAVDNLWDDIPGIGTVPGEDENYPTQKTERLLTRILEAASEPGHLVLDAFCGSGTTLAVAQALGREWIGCDANWGAMRTAAGRIRRAEESVGYRLLRVDGQTGPAPCDLQAKIGIDTSEGLTVVQIEDFHSPALVALAGQAGVSLPEDWRAQVRAVLIDPNYDGQIFRPAVVDAPAGKTALVAGGYRLPAAASGEGRVAVRLVDVAGGETTLEQLRQL